MYRINRSHPVATAACLAAFLLVTAGFVPHHGWSNYHQDRGMDLTGEIVEAKYENPHGTIRLETPDKTWFVVLAPTSRMQQRGLPPEMLKVGGTATVRAYPHKRIADEARAERIIIGEKTTELR